MTDFPPFSQLLSRATVQALQMRCLTFSRVNLLRNGESSKVGEYSSLSNNRAGWNKRADWKLS